MKRNVTIKGIRDLFVFSKEVKQITENIQKLRLLNQTLQACLPPLLAQYCQVQQYRNGVLTIRISSAAASTQLRFLRSPLIQKLKANQSFLCLSDIKIKTNHQQPDKLDRQYTCETEAISKESQSALQDAADNVSDPELSESLRRLSKTLSTKHGKKG